MLSPSWLVAVVLIGTVAPVAIAEPTETPDPELVRGLHYVVPDTPRTTPQLLVLRFWASWCVPCFRDLPTYNRTVQAMAGQPIQFISISPEKIDAITEALRLHSIAGAVASDEKGELMSKLGVDALPATVLLDPSGHVLARAVSQELTESMLRAALRGQDIELPNYRHGVSGKAEGDVVGARMAIATPNPEGSYDASLSIEERLFVARAATASLLIQQAYDVQQQQITWEVLPPADRFDLTIESGSETPYSWKPLLQAILRAGLGLEAVATTTEVSAYDMIINKDMNALRSLGGPSRISRRPGRIEFESVDLAGISVVLGEELGTSVKPSCNSRQLLDLALEWDPSVDGALLQAARNAGIELREYRRTERRVTVSRPTGCGKRAASDANTS